MIFYFVPEIRPSRVSRGFVCKSVLRPKRDTLQVYKMLRQEGKRWDKPKSRIDQV